MKRCFSKKDVEAFLSLVRLGISHTAYPFSQYYNWPVIQTLAYEQGLSAVVLDGIDKLPVDKRPPKDFALQWIGEVLQSYEYRYEQYCRVIAEMANLYNAHGLKMMVLKGYACSLNWPKPEHRPCGDIDIWQFGKQKEADNLLEKEKNIKIDSSHHHHTVFYWRDFMVENHYDFINVHHHKSNSEMEKILKELGEDDSYSVDLYGERVYLPSPNLHVLFLLKHASSHFASEGINLRQILDWGHFVQSHGLEIDWQWLEKVLIEYGMLDFFNIINAICVDDLGFDARIFPKVHYKPDLKERVLNEIIDPEYGVELPNGLLRRILFKFRRWKGSAWKHELCYKDSMWSAFWSGAWNHLLKPSSI